MDNGHREYGDGSFSRNPVELFDEINEEILDIIGWAFIQWVRLRELKNKTEERLNGLDSRS